MAIVYASLLTRKQISRPCILVWHTKAIPVCVLAQIFWPCAYATYLSTMLDNLVPENINYNYLICSFKILISKDELNSMNSLVEMGRLSPPKLTLRHRKGKEGVCVHWFFFGFKWFLGKVCQFAPTRFNVICFFFPWNQVFFIGINTRN